MFLLVSFLIFCAAMFAAGYYVWTVPEQHAADALTARMRELRARGNVRSRGATDLVRQEQRGALAFLGDFVAWIGVIRRLQAYIDQANLPYRAPEVAAFCAILAGVMFLALGIFNMSMVLLRLLIAAGFGAIPLAWIMHKRSARLKKFEENLPDAIDLFNRSMKAGHNIHSGLETIANETFDPVRMEFKKVIEELALGSPIESALHSLGGRVPLIDLKFFITSLILQRQTGANMVAVLENLALLVRERLNLAAKMKAATAQQRFSAGLLCAMPVVMGIGFWFLKPEYMILLWTDETGSKFLTAAVILEIVGILVIRKIASPKF